MGADLILAIWVIPKNRAPDWKAGKKAIRNLTKTDDLKVEKEWDDVASRPVIKDASKAHMVMTTAMPAYAPYLRYNLLISGGMTWGDDPTETFTTMERLRRYGIDRAMGFI